jgi:hypothetical protein
MRFHLYLIVSLLVAECVLATGCGGSGAADPCGDPAGRGCVSCTEPFADCNGDPKDGCETDTSRSSRSCGACGQACAGAEDGRSSCSGGRCAECPPSRRDCNGSGADGCETDIARAADHCGACAAVCPEVANGIRGCRNGRCGVHACRGGFADCNRDPSDGCETDLASDPRSCGSCGTVCPGVANGTAGCKDGSCTLTSCIPPLRSCRSGATQACTTNVQNDPDNCGSCGNVCAPVAMGAPSCVNGACVVGRCSAPFRDCMNGAMDGCETDVSRSTAHCGVCGNACAALPNATAACVQGQCGLGSCIAPWASCNGNAGDGCEANTMTDLAHCGGCGRSCAPPFANARCESGTCQITGCTSGRANCNGAVPDGCEAVLATDPQNCGGCGNSCPAPPHGIPGCSFSSCGLGGCVGAYGDCNGLLADGCEIDTASDPQNCGGCGRRCAVPANAFAAGCSGGSCVSLCALPNEDCNGLFADGCEINIYEDANNCGSCGRVCAAPPHATAGCAMGRCSIGSCIGTYRNCNVQPLDGCEVDTSSDPSHCGACFRPCAPSRKCVAGLCV